MSKDHNKEINLDVHTLGDPMERKRLELELRSIHVDHLNISSHLANLESDEILKRALLAQTKCLIRLYVIEAFDLSSRDSGSASDPYLYLTCNDKVFNERQFYQLDQPNPKFNKHFEWEGTFPGSSPI